MILHHSSNVDIQNISLSACRPYKDFDTLQDVETGLYRESSAYIYDLYKDELNFGHIVQAEI